MHHQALTLLYIDPGTGSLLMQIIAGSLIASVVFFKRVWYSMFSIFRRKPEAEHLPEWQAGEEE